MHIMKQLHTDVGVDIVQYSFIVDGWLVKEKNVWCETDDKVEQ